MPITAPPTPSSSPQNWFVYIVCCSDNSLYTGVTTDVTRRLHEHNNTARGAKYTRCRRPVTLVYFEQQESRHSACKREYAIKHMRPELKKQLIQASNATLHLGEGSADLV
ncbi:GIY-YIG nuclease family protein [Desulforhopalus sp. IMCC35007]|uniref:GIY-YIG nuclease family protein n=1 Tax=Desulforhopalus sp. IMCC35007 TaxID=2569543 RepID=UPI0010AE65CD|nr:GIY-YIG nuclease family protein [Desulforhopalus sp. IMCC35007]TKB08997.1 GIY-YIG nuclease family protein [Desulforhopalus sp. IMCC35007]